MIGRSSLKMEEKDTKSKRDEDESIQSKNGPPRMNRMNWKLRKWKLTGWRSTNDEEWMKNIEERHRNIHKIDHGNVSEALRKHLGLHFSHFLLLPNNFKWFLSYQGAKPLKLSPLTPFYKKMGEVVAAQLAQASWVASTWSNPLSRIF